MIAALYVAPHGSYINLPGVDPWPEERDARRYLGPHPVVAHPPCQRWGKFWAGQPLFIKQTGIRKIKGNDGGCFARALFGDGWQSCANLGPYVQSIVNELTEARDLIEIFERTEPDLIEKWRDLIEQRKGDTAALSTSPAPAEDVRATVIEECAKIAERNMHSSIMPGHVGTTIAAEIRSLTSPDPKQAMQDGGEG